MGAHVVRTLPTSTIRRPITPLDLAAWQRNRVVRLSVVGELDRSSAGALSREFDALLHSDWRALLVDAMCLSFMDCSGLSVFLEADARAEASGGMLAIARCSDPVRRVFSLTGSDRLLGRERIAIAMAFAEGGEETAWAAMPAATERALTA
jgi:anti-anti-sigma factor